MTTLVQLKRKTFQETPNQALSLTDHACKRATVQWEEAEAGSKAHASAPAAKRRAKKTI